MGFCLLFSLLSSALAQAPEVRIGIVVDGPWDRNASIRATFEKEIRDLLRPEFEAIFPADRFLVADWTQQGVRRAFESLLDDPDVDVVICSGVLASNEAIQRRDLPKPVIAPWVLDVELQDAPMREGASGIRNLSYVSWPPRLVRELRLFREIVEFENLTVLVNRAFVDGLPQLRERLSAGIGELGLGADFVVVEDRAEQVLKQIPESAEAVYMAPLLQLTDVEFSRLVQGLIERRLPSFSIWGREDVERGVMAGLAPSTDNDRVARRVALNLQRILLGEEAGELPVAFARGERLSLNVATARAIGVSPPWGVWTEADLIQEERLDLERKLDLAQAVREAVAANLELRVQDLEVAVGAEDIEQARSVLRPQLDVGGSAVLIDGDRAQASFGGTGRFNAAASATFSQLIYSERASAGVDIEGSLQAARLERRRQVRLDIVREAATAYLNVLRAKTFERIQKENLKITRSNLELAQVRRSVGFSGPAEVYRWESAIAQGRQAVIDASARRNVAEIALNRTLHRPLEEAFAVADADLTDAYYPTGDPRMTAYINDRASFAIFRDFLVAEGLAAAPELKRLDAAIEAQRRFLLSAERAFWSPTVGFQANAEGVGRAGGESGLGGLPIPIEFPVPNNFNWSLALSVTLPIFTGGERTSQRAQAFEELNRLRAERETASERIEQRIRSSAHLTGASWAGIALARAAAQAARQNLELVTDAYGRGVVSVIDLLDAQNAALVADEGAENAVHDFLVDLIEVERAVGVFYFELDGAGKESWFQRLEAFFQKARANTR